MKWSAVVAEYAVVGSTHKRQLSVVKNLFMWNCEIKGNESEWTSRKRARENACHMELCVLSYSIEFIFYFCFSIFPSFDIIRQITYGESAAVRYHGGQQSSTENVFTLFVRTCVHKNEVRRKYVLWNDDDDDESWRIPITTRQRNGSIHQCFSYGDRNKILDKINLYCRHSNESLNYQTTVVLQSVEMLSRRGPQKHKMNNGLSH